MYQYRTESFYINNFFAFLTFILSRSIRLVLIPICLDSSWGFFFSLIHSLFEFIFLFLHFFFAICRGLFISSNQSIWHIFITFSFFPFLLRCRLVLSTARSLCFKVFKDFIKVFFLRDNEASFSCECLQNVFVGPLSSSR